MNDNAVKWVEALRSGKYAQGKGRLRSDDDRFCCLGVACDLYAQEHEIEVTRSGPVYTYNGSTGLLPGKVRDWLGLKNSAGHSSGRNSLTDLNDELDYSLDMIADFIEDSPGLFIMNTRIKNRS